MIKMPLPTVEELDLLLESLSETDPADVVFVNHLIQGSDQFGEFVQGLHDAFHEMYERGCAARILAIAVTSFSAGAFVGYALRNPEAVVNACPEQSVWTKAELESKKPRRKAKRK